MPDLLTPTVDVPAEKAKLRRLRNQIAADVQRREAEQRKYSPRGYLRIEYLSYLLSLEAKGQPADGKAPHGALRARASVELPPTSSDVRQAQGGVCGHCGCACGVGQRGVK